MLLMLILEVSYIDIVKVLLRFVFSCIIIGVQFSILLLSRCKSSQKQSRTIIITRLLHVHSSSYAIYIHVISDLPTSPE